MKKVFITMLLVLALIAPMFAQGAQEQKATLDKDAPVTIIFWTHEDAARQKLEDQWIKEFMEAHPNVKIEVSRKDAEGLRQGVQTAYAADPKTSHSLEPADRELT